MNDIQRIESIEADLRIEHDRAWEKLMAYAEQADPACATGKCLHFPRCVSEDDLAIDAEQAEVSAFLDEDIEVVHQIGGWAHRAALGTLPTYATLTTAYAYQAKENE